MKAAIFKGPHEVVVGERPDPKVENPTDAVVRVVRGCVCGSDLWPYRGLSERQPNTPIGHEFIGVVEDIGPEVRSVKQGDFVIAPFKYSDGTCANCRAGWTSVCVHGGVFGNGDIDGGQGEAVGVPLADGTLVKVEGVQFTDEILASLLTLSDVMSTGHHAAVCGRVKKGDAVAVVGDGAVGLCGILAAKRLGAERILALSRNPDRQKVAKEFGATDILPQRGQEVIDTVLDMTDGIGVDAALECVGTAEAMDTAIAIARAGSMVGFVGVPHNVEVPINTMFGRNVGLHGGGAPARAYIPELLPDVLDGNINPGRVFDFATDLDHIAEAYEMMDRRTAIKSLLKISEV